MRLLISGLTAKHSDDDLRQKLSSFGVVKSIAKRPVKKFGLRPFTFVSIDLTEKDLNRLSGVLNGSQWKDGVLRIGRAFEKSCGSQKIPISQKLAPVKVKRRHNDSLWKKDESKSQVRVMRMRSQRSIWNVQRAKLATLDPTRMSDRFHFVLGDEDVQLDRTKQAGEWEFEDGQWLLKTQDGRILSSEKSGPVRDHLPPNSTNSYVEDVSVEQGRLEPIAEPSTSLNAIFANTEVQPFSILDGLDLDLASETEETEPVVQPVAAPVDWVPREAAPGMPLFFPSMQNQIQATRHVAPFRRQNTDEEMRQSWIDQRQGLTEMYKRRHRDAVKREAKS